LLDARREQQKAAEHSNLAGWVMVLAGACRFFIISRYWCSSEMPHTFPEVWFAGTFLLMTLMSRGHSLGRKACNFGETE
jgi:hypothetical protein